MSACVLSCHWMIFFFFFLCGRCLWTHYVDTFCGHFLWTLFVNTLGGHFLFDTFCLLFFFENFFGPILWTLFLDTFYGHILQAHFVDTFGGHFLWTLFVQIFCGHFFIGTSLWFLHFFLYAYFEKKLRTLFVDPFCGQFLWKFFVDIFCGLFVWTPLDTIWVLFWYFGGTFTVLLGAISNFGYFTVPTQLSQLVMRFSVYRMQDFKKEVFFLSVSLLQRKYFSRRELFYWVNTSGSFGSLSSTD